MRRFLLKTSVALLIVLAVHAFAGHFADGRLDAFYLRFTGERQGSLILGTSRAAQGLRPAVMMSEMGNKQRDGLFNFAFTVAQTPYGPAYLRAIHAKLEPAERNGLFLVTVDPWSLCDIIGPDIEPGTMPEEKYQVGEQWTFTGHPNYEYLVRNAPAGWGSFIGGPLHDIDTTMTLHRDGWLQVYVSLDSQLVAKRTEAKLKHYREEMVPKHRPGTTRLRYLEELVEMLRPHGRVVLVRMPVCNAMAQVEEELWPGLDTTLEGLASKHGIPYWNLMSERDRYTYSDGNHLDTTSARIFSADLAHRIASTGNTGF